METALLFIHLIAALGLVLAIAASVWAGRQQHPA